jgi:polar amino acid transport system substrate-binding protein
VNLNRRLIALASFAAIIATACSAITSKDSATNQTARLLQLLAPPSTTTTTAPPTCTTDADTARSYLPLAPLPAPLHMRAGSYMAEIQKRGYLIAGVDQNTLGFGYRNANGEIEGFDIDLVREIAIAIFGSPRVHFLAVTSSQRVPAVTGNEVDIVASAMSITCDRWGSVDFTTEYYAARQSVLVRADSPIKHVADLNGKTVCAASGSTSIRQIRNFAPRAKLDAVDLRTDCLVHLEQGRADAISTDDTILYGFKHQDDLNTRLLPDDLHQPERYGMAINQAHPEFVRFVNAVLQQVRSNGQWALFDRQLEQQTGIPLTTPPAPAYLSTP